MKIEKLQPGMTVYDVAKTKMGNTTIRTVSVWPVQIKEVDLENRKVVASWNGNPDRTYYERSVSRWKKEEPKLITNHFGQQRLATKAERVVMQIGG